MSYAGSLFTPWSYQGLVKGVNMNITTDQAFSLRLPAGFGGKWRVGSALWSNPSTSMAGGATAGGIYAAAGKTTPLFAASQTFTALVNPADVLGHTVQGGVTATLRTETVLYVSLTTACGFACTCDLYFSASAFPPLP